MREPKFSPKSTEDLDGILNYICQDNPSAGIRFLENLKEKCRTLAEFQKLGASREELAPGLRAISAGNYVIYYTTDQGAVRIERVLHGAQDRDAIFTDDV